MNEKDEQVLRKEILDFLIRFKEKVGTMSYDGWPMWWFFELRFTGDALMRPLPSHKEVAQTLVSGEKEGNVKKIKATLMSFALRKFLRYNEEIKIQISRLKKNKQARKKGGKKRIMFLAHTNYLLSDDKYGYTLDRVGTILKLVREDPILEEYVSFIDPLSHRSYSKLLKYDNLVYSYIDKGIIKKAKSGSVEIADKWTDIKKGLTFSKELLYITILYYETYKKIMKYEEIRALCYDSGTNIISRCAIAAADKIGANSLHVCHGTGVPFVPLEKPDSVYVAVIGEKYREAYIKWGMRPDRIIVTGPVFMDEIVPSIGKRNKTGEKKRILLATTPWIEDHEGEVKTYTDYIEKFLRETTANGDVEILIKLHPREKDLSIYQRIIDSWSYKNVKIIQRVGESQTKKYLYQLLTEVDVAMSFASTLSTEAMLIGIPAPIIDLQSRPQLDPILSDDRLLHLKPSDDLTEVCKNVLYDENYKNKLLERQNKVVQEYLYKVDGKAAERVVALIKQISA
jgi:hypothetical protein